MLKRNFDEAIVLGQLASENMEFIAWLVLGKMTLSVGNPVSEFELSPQLIVRGVAKEHDIRWKADVTILEVVKLFFSVSC